MADRERELTREALLETVQLLEGLAITVGPMTVLTALRVQARATWPSYDAVSSGLRKALKDGLLEQSPRTGRYNLPLRREAAR